MRKIIISVLFLLIVSNGFADVSNESLLKPLPPSFLINQIVRLSPIKDHHFNISAPHSCDAGKMVSITARNMECQFQTAGEQSLQVGVCDDGETFCKVEKISISIIATGSETAQSSKNVEKHSFESHAEDQVEGFITNDIDGAIQKAKNENKFLFIDMFGNWCPPCHELEEYVFIDPAFIDASKNLIKLRIDNDLKIAWPWNEKYRIPGLPTLLIVDPNTMDEIGRIVGSHPTSAIVRWIKNQEKLKGKTVQWAMTQTTESERIRVANWYLDRGENEKAIASVKKMKSKDADLIRELANSKIAWNRADVSGYKKSLEHLIQNHSDDIRVADWVLVLLEIDRDLGNKYVDQTIQSLKQWRSLPELSEQGTIDYDQGDLFEREAQIYEFIEDEQKAKQAYLNAADFMEELTKKSNLKLAKGSNLRRAEYLQGAGKNEEAEKLLRKLVNAYGDEFVFNYRYARVLYDMKKYKNALTYADKAEKQSYGDNWLRILNVKAKILIGLNRKQDAQNLINDALARVDLPETSAARTQAMVRELQKTLVAAGQ